MASVKIRTIEIDDKRLTRLLIRQIPLKTELSRPELDLLQVHGKVDSYVLDPMLHGTGVWYLCTLGEELILLRSLYLGMFEKSEWGKKFDVPTLYILK